MTTLETLRVYNQHFTRTQARIAADPAIKRQTEYFERTIATIKTSKDFVNNFRVFSYAMAAHGLSDMSYATAFIKKMLDGGLADPASAANRITDPRFNALVSAFNFGDRGAAATADTARNASTVARFIAQTTETEAGRTDPGAQLALYFQRVAPGLKSSYQLLADKALSQVVQTVLQLPPAASATALDNTAAAIDRKLRMADLQDPAKLQSLITRFAVNWDAEHSHSGTNSATQILRKASTSNAVLTKIQRAYSIF